MFCAILLCRIAAFKVRAKRRCPREYIELLFGLHLDNYYEIRKFAPIKHTSQTYSININDEVYEDTIARYESETGLEFLGTIHSHPGRDSEAEPSLTDNNGARRWEERIFAIDKITRTKSGRLSHQVTFWFPQTPVDNITFE